MQEDSLIELVLAAQTRALGAFADAIAHLEGVDGERFLDDLSSTISLENPPDTPIGMLLAALVEELESLKSSVAISRFVNEKYPMDDD